MNSDNTAQDFDLRLVDASGTGYHLFYRRGATEIAAHFFLDGELVWGEEFEADTRDIEYMLATPSSVARAIADDEAKGHLYAAFNDGFAGVAERLHMNFKLAHPESNTHVTCCLDLVDENDSAFYEFGVSFILPIEDLQNATAHLEAVRD